MSERLAHEYCYFLHDACVGVLGEYEKAQAHFVRFDFVSETEAAHFEEVAQAEDAVAGLRAIGRLEEARRVALNSITMAMVSDCMHHVFEALHCMEKRKFVVALNLLRKPLLDSLVFLSWMLGDEEDFYRVFTEQSPTGLTGKAIGNRRPEILTLALSKTEVEDTISAEWIDSVLFDAANQSGLYWLLQRAVHLITTQRIELRTEPENFNFIFKPHTDDDVYIGVYDALPGVLLYLSHVVAKLFQRMQPWDDGARKAFNVRSIYGFHLVRRDDMGLEIQRKLSELSKHVICDTCGTPARPTYHNIGRILLNESFRCTSCRRVAPFPFAWLF
ncbi:MULTISPECIES: hypothetical protein [Cupriavidus]